MTVESWFTLKRPRKRSDRRGFEEYNTLDQVDNQNQISTVLVWSQGPFVVFKTSEAHRWCCSSSVSAIVFMSLVRCEVTA